MTKLSPAAQAVLTAVTQRQYCLDPCDVPEATGRIKYEAAAVLRAAADQAENVHPARPSTERGEGWLEGVQDVVAGFRRIADELDAQP
jgi:hypothetical protein